MRAPIRLPTKAGANRRWLSPRGRSAAHPGGAALHGLAHYLAPRVADEGVTVNAIALGLIAGTHALPVDPDDRRVLPLRANEYRPRLPARRVGSGVFHSRGGLDVDYDQFVGIVSQRGGLPREQAEAIARTTLETLSELITPDEVEDLAAQLPKPLKEQLHPHDRTESYGVDEFVRRVSERAKVPTPVAAIGVKAGLTTVREAVTEGEFDDVVAQLPDEYAAVIGPPDWRGRR
jgi:uncharacterized protein (DUF2267 family)